MHHPKEKLLKGRHKKITVVGAISQKMLFYICWFLVSLTLIRMAVIKINQGHPGQKIVKIRSPVFYFTEPCCQTTQFSSRYRTMLRFLKTHNIKFFSYPQNLPTFLVAISLLVYTYWKGS